MSDIEQRVFRVTVRGRFHELSDRARRYVVGAQAEHDIFVSAFTPEGTFTDDDRILFFDVRYEVRARPHGRTRRDRRGDARDRAVPDENGLR